MTEKWNIRSHSGNYAALGNEYGVSPIIARILRNREIQGKEAVASFLSPDGDKLKEYRLIQNMDELVLMLHRDIKEGKHIRVIGDYDIDGVCSTYILTKGILRCGGSADHVIPHRVKDGYGLNDNLIRNASADGVDTIITCDNGISAAQQVELAHNLGMKVLVTDHHEIPFHTEDGRIFYDIPSADAVVDIKMPECVYPFRELCGAAVAMKVTMALYEKSGIDIAEAEKFEEFAAFATIGDVMPLVGENRVLVKKGLTMLEKSSNTGMRALIKAQGLEGRKLTPYHVGFVLGPCINATGRLDTAENAMKLFCTEDQAEAERMAVELKSMNEERRLLTDDALKKALELASLSDDRVLVLYIPDCHESIAGIVAGKVREHTGRPAFVLTRGETCVKGSGRSIDEYNMYEGMNSVSDLFIQFGGHALAGGLSMEEKNIEEFRKRINEGCSLTDDDIACKVIIDMELPFSYIDEKLAEEMQLLEPYGNGNAKPLFVTREVKFSGIRIFGKTRNILKAAASDNSVVKMDAIYFGDRDAVRCLNDKIAAGELLCITYNIGINEYKGRRNIELQIRNYR